VSDCAVAEPLLTIGETARRLRVSRSAVTRMFTSGVLSCVRYPVQRKAYEGQVDHVVAAMREGRPGSIKQFAAEWATQRQQPQAVA
jgi:hypothetical protein